MKTKFYYIYILECSNGKFYTGYTIDIKKRYADHLAGKASKFTRSFRPNKLAVCWKIRGSKGDALRIEAMIKRLTHKHKKAFTKNPGSLRDFVRMKLQVISKILT